MNIEYLQWMNSYVDFSMQFDVHAEIYRSGNLHFEIARPFLWFSILFRLIFSYYFLLSVLFELLVVFYRTHKLTTCRNQIYY